MYTVELEAEESELLRGLVDQALGTLEIELHHTDHAEFKERLRRRRRLLEHLTAKLAHHEPLSA